MKNAPIFSVIIPVFNAENTLSRCVNSILNQSIKGFEIILINDGSTDNSAILCDNFMRDCQQVKVFHKENGGVSSARNLGISSALGEWIIFVDSDDYVESTYLENFINHRFNIDDDELVIQGVIYDSQNNYRKHTFENSVFSRDEIVKCITNNNLLTFGAPYCKLYNSRIIKENALKFPEHYCYGEDTIFFLNYIKYVKQIRLLSSCNYHYMESGSDSLSRKSHPFNQLKFYLVDNLTAVRNLEVIFTCPHKLMRAHGKNISGLLKKMLVDLHRICESSIRINDAYSEMRKVIRMFSCYRYSSWAAFLLLCPVFISEFLLKRKLR